MDLRERDLIVKVFKFLQSLKAFLPIVVMFSPTVNDLSFVQPLKALALTAVILNLTPPILIQLPAVALVQFLL